MQEPFDFSAFLENAQNPDDDTRRKVLREAVGDEMEAAMGEVAPRIWCVLQEQMLVDAQNNVHLNAVINAALFAVVGWTAACTPKGESNGLDNDDTLRDKIMKNLDQALKTTRNSGSEMSMIAHNVGKLKLMDDSMNGLAKVLTSNSMIIQGIHQTIKGGKPPV